MRSRIVVYIPRGIPHGFTVGMQRAKKLMIFVPGAMESYFEKLDAALRAGSVSPERVAAIALREHGGPRPDKGVRLRNVRLT